MAEIIFKQIIVNTIILTFLTTGSLDFILEDPSYENFTMPSRHAAMFEDIELEGFAGTCYLSFLHYPDSSISMNKQNISIITSDSYYFDLIAKRDSEIPFDVINLGQAYDSPLFETPYGPAHITAFKSGATYYYHLIIKESP